MFMVKMTDILVNVCRFLLLLKNCFLRDGNSRKEHKFLSVFKCEKCSDKFSGLESLKGHLGKVHGFCFNVKARNSSFSI